MVHKQPHVRLHSLLAPIEPILLFGAGEVEGDSDDAR